MVRPRATRSRQQSFPAGIVTILICGQDFFSELPRPGGAKGNLDLLRRAWQDPDIRTATLADFARKMAFPKYAERYPTGQCWAANQFGE